MGKQTYGYQRISQGKEINWKIGIDLYTLCVCVCVCVCVVCPWSLSQVQLFANPWTIAHQAPLSMRFPRKEYWSGLPLLWQEIFPTQGSNPCLLHLLHWQLDSLPLQTRTQPTSTNSFEENIYPYLFWANLRPQVTFSGIYPSSQQILPFKFRTKY